MPASRHHFVGIDDLKIFVREAGNPARPTVVPDPGNPSSTRSYIRLIDRLARKWDRVAIDYPGFGSSEPLPESLTCGRLAEVTGKAIDALGIGDDAISLFDSGDLGKREDRPDD